MAKQQKKLFDFKLLKRLFSFVEGANRKALLGTVVMSLIIACIAPLRPYLIQLSVDQYISHHLLKGLILISIIHFGLLLMESGIRFYFLYQINWLGQSVVNLIRKTVFRKIMFQNIAYFDKTAIGTLTTRTVNDMESVNDVFSEGIISIVADIMTIIAIMTVMFYTDWRLTLIVLITFPAIIFATYMFKESVNKSFQSVRDAVAALNAFVQEHLTGMNLVQSFAAEQRELTKFNEINKQHRDANIKAIFAYSVFFPVVEIILAISLGLLVWYGAVRILDHHTTAGVVIAFVMYLNLLFRPLRMLADKFNVLQMGLVAAERVFGVLDNQDFQINNGSYSPDTIEGNIEFKNVHFSYEKEVPVLKGISFELRAGKTLAIVGHTGAGKSSIISILNRMYEISKGEILLDGENIQAYNSDNLRQKIGIVLQDVFLFSGTVRDNVTLRNEAVTLQEVESVCKLLGIHDFIMQLPGNYEFNIRERGNSLSQGQRQLLSFARALVYNPSILILDEATSSVDSESEQLIQQAIEKMIKGRTSIVIAHRLSTIRKADKILVLDKGEIIEEGNHETLLAKGGQYAQLYLFNQQKTLTKS